MNFLSFANIETNNPTYYWLPKDLIPYYYGDNDPTIPFNEKEVVEDMASGNFKEALKILMNSYEFNGYTNAAVEYFAGFYQYGDSGDEADYSYPVLHKPNKNHVNKKALHRRHRANILKDKQKHGKSDNWFSPEYTKRETNKRTRKEFILPSGKKGYKKMMNDWFIC